jgi:hypothetical protein
VVLDVEVASEIADLIADEPGTADEALLDSALASIDDAQPRLSSTDQERAGHGDIVAMELSPDAAEAVETLIRDDQVTEPQLLERVANRLRDKVRQARRRRRNQHQLA